MEMLYVLIAFVIGGVVGGVIMSLRKRAGRCENTDDSVFGSCRSG